MLHVGQNRLLQMPKSFETTLPSLLFLRVTSKINPHKQMLSHGVRYTFTSGIKLSFSLHSSEEVRLWLPELPLNPCLPLNITVSDRMEANVSPSVGRTKTRSDVLNKQRAGSS